MILSVLQVVLETFGSKSVILLLLHQLSITVMNIGTKSAAACVSNLLAGRYFSCDCLTTVD